MGKRLLTPYGLLKNKVNSFFKRKQIFNVEDNKLLQTEAQKWIKDQGDDTLRLNYPLTSNSIVFDVGGFNGDWSSKIFCMYDCNIYVFEPVILYYENIQRRFIKNDKVTVVNKGLSSTTGEAEFFINSNIDGSSFILRNDVNNIRKSIVTMISAKDFIDQNKITSIDLIKINIEGGEYDLLEHIICSGIINKIKNIQVQFHDFVENHETRLYKLRQFLSRTHVLTYCYEYIWENWEKKDDIVSYPKL